MSIYYDEVRRSIDGSGGINSFFQSRVFSGLFQSSFYLYQLLRCSDLHLHIAFSLCGFLISTYSSNGVLIRCAPFLVMILDSIIATSISGIGTLVNYSDSAQILARSSPLGFAMDSLFRLLIPILLVVLLCRVIRKRSD